jgi:hypothetical protein
MEKRGTAASGEVCVSGFGISCAEKRRQGKGGRPRVLRRRCGLYMCSGVAGIIPATGGMDGRGPARQLPACLGKKTKVFL